MVRKKSYDIRVLESEELIYSSNFLLLYLVYVTLLLYIEFLFRDTISPVEAAGYLMGILL